MTTITLQFDNAHNVWKATGKDAKVVFNAIGLNDYFKVHGDQPAIIHPDNLEKFTTKMKETYNIDVITNY
jgi:hypothetical protein